MHRSGSSQRSVRRHPGRGRSPYSGFARVATVHKNQNLMLAANGATTPILIPMPYTIGLWEETQPVGITLSKGLDTLRFAGAKENLGVPLKDFTLNPAR